MKILSNGYVIGGALALIAIISGYGAFDHPVIFFAFTTGASLLIYLVKK
jgi:hypothetical protein